VDRALAGIQTSRDAVRKLDEVASTAKSSSWPDQYRGVVGSEPGLYFVGLEHLYAAVSDILPGVGRDAGYVARHIASRAYDTAR